MRGTVYHNIMEYDYHGDGNIAYKVDKYYGSSYNTKEWYKYDVMNLGLTSISAGVCTNYSGRITYDGNRIISKTGIGNYQYGCTLVNAVLNSSNNIKCVTRGAFSKCLLLGCLYFSFDTYL